jgi:hypothetical protein
VLEARFPALEENEGHRGRREELSTALPGRNIEWDGGVIEPKASGAAERGAAALLWRIFTSALSSDEPI